MLIGSLCLIGLVVLLQLNRTAQLVALASLALVAAYPFMKRITWWPQAWLGLVFSLGRAGRLAGGDRRARLRRRCWLWLGSVAWVIGYDTLYAIQDMEDDALVGVKSSALGGSATRRRWGSRSSMRWRCCCGARRSGRCGRTGWRWSRLLPAALHLANQALRADPKDGEGALALFRSNRTCGLLVFLAMLVGRRCPAR